MPVVESPETAFRKRRSVKPKHLMPGYGQSLCHKMWALANPILGNR